MELNAARSSGGFGAAPIGYAEIDAWARLTGRAPQIWEVALLRRLDRLWLDGPPKEAQ